MIGLGLDLRQRSAGAAAPMAAVTSLEVLGAEPLPDGADAAIPNGWVAKMVLPDTGPSSFDPKKISLTVIDPGFDKSGDPVSVTRTVTGTAVLRRQYPNNTERLTTASAGARTVYFALSDVIYAGSVVVAASAGAGFYGSAQGGAIGGRSNASTLVYPRPQFGWLNLQHERAEAASFAVEAVAYHRHAMNGQQVACVRFQARDAQGTPNLSPAMTVSAPALSSLQTGGNIVEAWKAALDLSGLAQGDLAQVNALVYPWIGDEPLDTMDAAKGAQGALAAGSAVNVPYGATPLRVLNDRTGAYGGLVAYVRAGASGGAVGSGATPFGTVQAALAALATANAARGHADHSGSTIWLMDDGAGGAVDHAIGASSATVAGKCWTDIRVDPAATGQVRATVTASVATADLVRLRCPIVVTASGAAAGFSGTSPNVRRIAFDGCSVSYTATPATPLVIGIGLAYWRNCAFANVTATPFFTFSTNRSAPALVLGCTGTFTGAGAGSRQFAPYLCVGNSLEGLSIAEFPASHVNAFGHDGGVIANNRLSKQSFANSLAQDRALNGFARVQNVFETAGVPSITCWGIGNDGKVAPFAEFVSMHNSVPGTGIGGANIGRQNACYADVTGAAGVQKTMTEMFDILHNRNSKGDTFTGNTPGTVTNTGRTGTWRYRYGVGSLGNVVVTGDAQSGAASAPNPDGAGGNGNWTGEYWEPGSVLVAGEANVVFVDNRAGSAGAGGGDYRLAESGGGHAARGRVPAGRAVLKFDLAGLPRRNDGTGAAGAYERG